MTRAFKSFHSLSRGASLLLSASRAFCISAEVDSGFMRASASARAAVTSSTALCLRAASSAALASSAAFLSVRCFTSFSLNAGSSNNPLTNNDTVKESNSPVSARLFLAWNLLIALVVSPPNSPSIVIFCSSNICITAIGSS